MDSDDDDIIDSGSDFGPVALITDISDQLGFYLAEFLLSKGYEVHGIILPKKSSGLSLSECQKIRKTSDDYGSINFHHGDTRDTIRLVNIISAVQPTEVYNLVSESLPEECDDMSEYTAQVGAVGTLRLLDALKVCRLEKKVRFCQVSLSDLYGENPDVPQAESTRFHPTSPTGCADVYSYWIVQNYREAYKMFACNAVLFNHESPRREETYVTRKVTLSVAKIASGVIDCFELGKLDSKRDWGHAKDYARAMWLMLQQEEPNDFVIATGESHSVRELVEEAFAVIGKRILWEGSGEGEVGKEEGTGDVRVKINPEYFHPSSVDILQGNAGKAREKLRWRPEISFKELVKEMVEADMELLQAAPDAAG